MAVVRSTPPIHTIRAGRKDKREKGKERLKRPHRTADRLEHLEKPLPPGEASFPRRHHWRSGAIVAFYNNRRRNSTSFSTSFSFFTLVSQTK